MDIDAEVQQLLTKLVTELDRLPALPKPEPATEHGFGAPQLALAVANRLAQTGVPYKTCLAIGFIGACFVEPGAELGGLPGARLLLAAANEVDHPDYRLSCLVSRLSLRVKCVAHEIKAAFPGALTSESLAVALEYSTRKDAAACAALLETELQSPGSRVPPVTDQEVHEARKTLAEFVKQPRTDPGNISGVAREMVGVLQAALARLRAPSTRLWRLWRLCRELAESLDELAACREPLGGLSVLSRELAEMVERYRELASAATLEDANRLASTVVGMGGGSLPVRDLLWERSLMLGRASERPRVLRRLQLAAQLDASQAQDASLQDALQEQDFEYAAYLARYSQIYQTPSSPQLFDSEHAAAQFQERQVLLSTVYLFTMPNAMDCFGVKPSELEGAAYLEAIQPISNVFTYLSLHPGLAVAEPPQGLSLAEFRPRLLTRLSRLVGVVERAKVLAGGEASQRVAKIYGLDLAKIYDSLGRHAISSY